MAVVTAGVVTGLAAAGSAVAANKQAKSQRKAAEAASAPQEFSQHTDHTAWGPAMEFARRGLNRSENLYKRQLRDMAPPPELILPRAPSGGGSQVHIPGASGQSQEIADLMLERARDQSYLGGAQDFSQSLWSADPNSNPLLFGSYDQASTRDPLFESFIQQGMVPAGGEGGPSLSDFASLALSGGPPPQYQEAEEEQGLGRSSFEPRAYNELDAMRAANRRKGVSGGHGASAAAAAAGRMGSASGGAGSVNRGGRYAMDPRMDAEMDRLLGGQYLEEENPYLQGVVDDLSSDMQSAFHDSTALLRGQAEGVGLLGSGYYGEQLQNAQSSFDDSLASAVNDLRYQNYGDERQNMMAALGLLNSRDASIWGDQTARYGIDAQSASANAARAAASSQHQSELDFARDQLASNYELANRGMGLEALLGIGQQDLSRMGIMGDFMLGDQGQRYGQMASMAGLLGDQQMGALGAAPGIEAARFGGLQTAYGAQQGIDSQNQSAAQSRAAHAAQQANAQRAWQNQVAAMQNDHRQRSWEYNQNREGQVLDQFLGRVGGIANLGGSSHTSGVQPGTPTAAPSVGGATVQGGLGGALTGLGIVSQLLPAGSGRGAQATPGASQQVSFNPNPYATGAGRLF